MQGKVEEYFKKIEKIAKEGFPEPKMTVNKQVFERILKHHT